MPNRDTIRRFSGRALLLLAGLALALALGEALIRAWLQAAQGGDPESWRLFVEGRTVAPRSRHALAAITRVSPNRGVLYELRPGLDLPFGGVRLRTNRLGARADRDYPDARAPDSVRIVGIGDSGMFGWDVEQDEPYLAVLERNLNAARTGTVFEAVNLAVPGYNTRQELERLKATGQPLRPDVVVVGWCANDFSLPFFRYKPRNHWRERAWYVGRLLFDREAFLELASPEVVKGREAGPAGAEPDDMGATLAELKALSEAEGFHVLVFGPMRADIQALCRAAGLDFVNTFEALPPDRAPRSARVHDMHPKPEGHRLLADLLQRELDRRGWLVPFSGQ